MMPYFDVDADLKKVNISRLKNLQKVDEPKTYDFELPLPAAAYGTFVRSWSL